MIGSRPLSRERSHGWSAVLLVEFNDETGLHYNLPGGGVEPGESVIEALEREVRENAE
jgi:8-oxo-dGTP diphosphatase